MPVEDGDFFVPGCPVLGPSAFDAPAPVPPASPASTPAPMTRLLAALAVALAGCGTAPSGLSPDDAFQSAMAAVDSGDVRRALRLLDEAADAGHLDALAVRAGAYRRGYLQTDYGRGYQRGVLPSNLPFFVLPGQAGAAGRAYQDALAAGAARHDADAMFRLAHELAQPQWINSERIPPADLDSARAIYDRLNAQSADPFRLAMLALSLHDTDERNRQLDVATEAGDGRACWWTLWTGPRRNLATAAGFSDYVDDAEACPLDLQADDPVADDLRALAGQVRAGNDAASALLDSLRAEGVFRRHPRLAALVAG